MRLLGKKPFKDDSRHLLATEFLKPLTIAPTACRWSQGTQSGVMRNDELGCCTIAAAGHMIQCWTGNASGRVSSPTDQQIEDAYWATGDQDDGRYMADVLKYWRQTGIGGHRIEAYGLIRELEQIIIRQMALVCGGIYLGLRLPEDWQSADVWDKPETPEDQIKWWGLHAVNLVDYGSDGVVVTTWGYPQRMTWRGLLWFCDEAWVIPSRDFLTSGIAPNSFDLDSMLERVLAL